MKLIIAIPGDTIQGAFFDSVWKFVTYMKKYRDVDITIIRKGGSHVGWVRETIIGYREGQKIDAPDRVIFGGQEYDYVLWLDTDQVFEPKHFEMLIDVNQPFVSGWYRIVDKRNVACVMEKKEGVKYTDSHYMPAEEIKKRTELIDCWHTGLGFTLLKKGVIESIKPPYFMDSRVTQSGELRYAGEDVAFAFRAREAGIKIWCHPECDILHNKMVLM